MKVYLSGPITGLALREAYQHFKDREASLRAMSEGALSVLNPMSGKMYFENNNSIAQAIGEHEDPDIAAISGGKAIFRRDLWMTQQADVLLCDLTRAFDKPSLGSAFEIAWASKQPNTLIVIAGLRPGHSMNHDFVIQAAAHLFGDYRDAEKYVAGLAISARS